MGKLRDRLTDVHFHCRECDHRFDAEPARVEDAPEDGWHPWRYYAPCPLCREEATQGRQARHLLKLWASATGPTTPAGKAASAENLKGHPTPEEAQRTRFNAMKHGLTARTATYWPARPGRYPQCDSCELLYNGCSTGDACQKKTELFLRHHIAFDTGDPKILGELRADLHANLSAIISDLMLAVIADGARIRTPEWYYDKEGGFHLARYTDQETGDKVQIYKIENHPSIKLIGELVSRLGLDLNSQGMTPKVQDDADVLRGHLAAEEQNAGVLLEFQQRQTKALEALGGMIERSRATTARDPVLLEHEAGNEDG